MLRALVVYIWEGQPVLGGTTLPMQVARILDALSWTIPCRHHDRIKGQEKMLSLSWNLGLKEYNVKSPKERLRLYREFVYARGGVDLDPVKSCLQQGPLRHLTGQARAGSWMLCPCQNRWSASSSAPAFLPG